MHTVQLGAAFTTPVPPQPPTGDERRHVELLAELAAVQEALWTLARQGPPVVHLPPTDLTEVIQALDGMGVPGLVPERLDPREMAEALADALQSRQVDPPADRTDEVLEELKRIGRKFGVALANSTPIVSNVGVKNEPGQSLDTQEAALDTRYEWQLVGAASKPLEEIIQRHSHLFLADEVLPTHRLGRLYVALDGDQYVRAGRILERV